MAEGNDGAVEAHDVAQLRALVCELAVKLEQQKVRTPVPCPCLSLRLRLPLVVRARSQQLGNRSTLPLQLLPHDRARAYCRIGSANQLTR